MYFKWLREKKKVDRKKCSFESTSQNCKSIQNIRWIGSLFNSTLSSSFSLVKVYVKEYLFKQNKEQQNGIQNESFFFAFDKTEKRVVVFPFKKNGTQQQCHGFILNGSMGKEIKENSNGWIFVHGSSLITLAHDINVNTSIVGLLYSFFRFSYCWILFAVQYITDV